MVAQPQHDVWQEMIEFGGDLAAEWLRRYEFEPNRALDHKYKKYVRLMQEGKFEETAIHLGHVGDRAFLINGKRRMSALVEAKVRLRLVVIHKVYPDMRALRRAATAHDTPMATRSLASATDAWGLLEELDINKREGQALNSSIPLVMRGYHPPAPSLAISPAERLETAEAWGPWMAAYSQAINNARGDERDALLLAGVCSVGLATFRWAEPQALQFWEDVADADSLPRDTPANTLIRKVLLRRGQRPRDYVLARLVAACWNAHMEGRDLQMPRVGDMSKPIRLNGTPFNGRARLMIAPGKIEVEAMP